MLAVAACGKSARGGTAAVSVTEIDLGRSLGVDLTLAEAAMRRYETALAAGHAEKDIAAVILPIEAQAGVTVGTAAS